MIEYPEGVNPYYDGFDDGYKQGRADAIEEFREYLKSCCSLIGIPQDVWDIGVDATCNRMLKEQKNVRK